MEAEDRGLIFALIIAAISLSFFLILFFILSKSVYWLALCGLVLIFLILGNIARQEEMNEKSMRKIFLIIMVVLLVLYLVVRAITYRHS